MNIGDKLKELRLKRSLSLEQLAQRVGLTKSFLSQAEKNKTSPSIASLMKILGALNVTMGEFFREEGERRGVVLRKGERKAFYNPTSKTKMEVLSSGFVNPKMEAFYGELEAGGSTETIVAQGEVFGFILKGSIELALGNETYLLKPGDCVYYDASVPHSWRAVGKAKASGIWVASQSILKTF